MVRTLVITALGRESFTERQLRRLDRLGSADGDSIDLVGRTDQLSDAEFVRLAQPYEVLALTRRPKKHLNCELLRRLPNLRAVVVHTTGIHWIDGEYLPTETSRCSASAATRRRRSPSTHWPASSHSVDEPISALDRARGRRGRPEPATPWVSARRVRRDACRGRRRTRADPPDHAHRLVLRRGDGAG